MSNRCPDCEKFVSLTPVEDPEWNTEPEIDEDGCVTGELRVVLECAECGEEMKEAVIEVAITPDEIEGLSELETSEENKAELEAAVDEARDKAKREFLIPFESGIVVMDEGMLGEDEQLALEGAMDDAEEKVREEWAGECEFEVECTSVSIDEELQTTDRNGKPIKSARYMKKFYVVEMEFEIKCPKRDWSTTHIVREKIQASHFDDLN